MKEKESSYTDPVPFFFALTHLFIVFVPDPPAGEPHRGGEGGAGACQDGGGPQSSEEAACQAICLRGITVFILFA